MKMLDITSFENSINSLDNILKRYEKEYDIDIRDAVIQRFEYTYSLAIKIITKFINQTSANNEVMTFNELIRKANQFGLLENSLEVWDDYRKCRNMTSHTYNEQIAEKVVKIIPKFKNETLYLLNKLKERLK